MRQTADRLNAPGNQELADILGSVVVERKPLHGWPLSQVEEIRTETQRYVLKSQLSCASVERAFYEQIRHPMLMTPCAGASLGNWDYLILPYAGGGTEDWSGLCDDQIRLRVRQLRQQLSLPGNAPVFFDFSTFEKWMAAWQSVGHVLSAGGFLELEFEAVTKWLESCGSTCWDTPVSVLHGDLKGENILRDEQGNLFVIDWQRPLMAPLALEECIALLLAGRDGNSYDPFAVLARMYLSYWYAWAYQTCLPVSFVQGTAVKYARTALEYMNQR